MRSTGERFFMLAAIVCVLLVIAAVGFQMVTERKRSAAVAQLRKPAILAQRHATAATSGAGAESGGQVSSGAAPGASLKAAESIPAFTALFPKVRAHCDEPQWKTLYDAVFLKKAARDWTVEEQAAAMAFAKEARPLIQEIRRLAESGGPVTELDYSKGFAIELPHLAPLRECARLLLIDAKAQSLQGNYGDAVEDIVAGLKLGGVVKDEPILISQLVRCAIDGIAYSSVQDVLPPEGVAPELVQRVIDGASHAEAHQYFAESFTGEGMFGLDAFDRIREGNAGSIIGEPLSPAPGATSIFLTVYGSAIARPWLNMDEAAFSETMARMQEAACLPYYQAQPAMDQISRDVESLPRTRVLTRQLLPALTRAIAAQARDEAMLALVQVGLALELYHAQNGAYPASLDAVSPMFGGSVPVDPFTGRPLGYKPSAQSFVLYSVGENMMDDGGSQGYRDGGGFDYRTGDIVWRAAPKTQTEKR